jgi:hypothetical protein
MNTGQFNWEAAPDTYDCGGTEKGDAEYQRVSPAMPEGLVGEYLPDLDDGEVEIVMIGMNSAMGDVISVRARHEGEQYNYSIVNEYGSEYEFAPATSDRPLTFRELTDLLWSITIEGWGRLFQQQWIDDLEYAGQRVDRISNDFYELQSDYYDGLQEWLDWRFEQWAAEKRDATSA